LEIPLDVAITVLMGMRTSGLRYWLLTLDQVIKFLPADELVLLEEKGEDI
jgi:hypothetical protein